METAGTMNVVVSSMSIRSVTLMSVALICVLTRVVAVSEKGDVEEARNGSPTARAKHPG